jgi:Fe-S-cluster containining protein
MNAASAFSYACNRCGLCCRDKVITLAPYDLIRLARAAGITTAQARARYTARRGSLLRFAPGGGCSALEGARCTVHRGRPLACRLYPLGLERKPLRDGSGLAEHFVRLEPAAGSRGVYGEAGTIAEFLAEQEVAPYLDAGARYHALAADLGRRVDELVDFEKVEPREFWRCAVREALAESNYDPNPLIDALFDPDGLGCARADPAQTVEAHLASLRIMADAQRDGACVAAAAMMLSASLGYVGGGTGGGGGGACLTRASI